MIQKLQNSLAHDVVFHITSCDLTSSKDHTRCASPATTLAISRTTCNFQNGRHYILPRGEKDIEASVICAICYLIAHCTHRCLFSHHTNRSEVATTNYKIPNTGVEPSASLSLLDLSDTVMYFRERCKTFFYFQQTLTNRSD